MQVTIELDPHTKALREYEAAAERVKATAATVRNKENDFYAAKAAYADAQAALTKLESAMAAAFLKLVLPTMNAPQCAEEAAPTGSKENG